MSSGSTGCRGRGSCCPSRRGGPLRCALSLTARRRRFSPTSGERVHRCAPLHRRSLSGSRCGWPSRTSPGPSQGPLPLAPVCVFCPSPTFGPRVTVPVVAAEPGAAEREARVPSLRRSPRRDCSRPFRPRKLALGCVFPIPDDDVAVAEPVSVAHRAGCREECSVRSGGARAPVLRRQGQPDDARCAGGRHRPVAAAPGLGHPQRRVFESARAVTEARSSSFTTLCEH